MKQRKGILLLSALVFIVAVSSLPQGVQAGTYYRWIDVSMNAPSVLFGSYDAGTQTASEALVTTPGGSSSYTFDCGWFTTDSIPGGANVVGVRVKFYFKAYYYWFGCYYNEAMKLDIYAGASHWGTYTYSPSNYLNGAYVYVDLGSAAEYQRIHISFRDGSPTGDLSFSAWTLGQPVVQVLHVFH